MDVIKNCLITNSDAKVLREYCVDKNSPLYTKYKGFNTSMNLEAVDVYNLYFGTITLIAGNSRIGYDVFVRIDGNQGIKYSNLKSIDVSLNRDIDIGQKIGVANKYVRVEYLNNFIQNSYPFRLGDDVFYKDDPSKIINGDGLSVMNTSFQYSQSGLQDVVDEYDGGDNSEVTFITDWQEL